MSKKGRANGSFFGNHIYESLLARRSHLLYELGQVVDFSFVRHACRDFYVDWGRDAWDPVLMFKMVFLQFLYDLSDREVEERATYDMAFKWFLGLSAEEFPPDHTTLCRFRQRLGAEGFRNLFNQVVAQARAQGFVSDRLHILDATHMAAKVDLFRVKQEHANQDNDDDQGYIDRGSPDPEARFGRKSKKQGFYGYKCHMVEDADSELIVQATATPGNVHDGRLLPELIDAQPREATADKAYDSKSNHAYLASQGVTSGIIRRHQRPGRPRHSKRERPKIERKFAECKSFHGLRKARYWGLAKVMIQTFMVAIVVNCKRLVKLAKAQRHPPRAAYA